MTPINIYIKGLSIIILIKLTFRKLGLAISEFESINQCNEEIIESMKETEKDFNLKLDNDMAQISALRQQILDSDKRLEEYETIMLKFRRKIADLNEEVQNQKDEVCFIILKFESVSNLGRLQSIF